MVSVGPSIEKTDRPQIKLNSELLGYKGFIVNLQNCLEMVNNNLEFFDVQVCPRTRDRILEIHQKHLR